MSRKLKKPSKVVVSGEMKRSPFSLPKTPKQLLLVVAVVVLAVAAVAGGAWLVNNYVLKTKPVAMQRSTVCTDNGSRSIAGQAAGLLTPKSQRELKVIVDKIQALPDYQKDPNCLFIITQYYINRNDSKNAKLNYDKLVQVYDPQKGFYGYFQYIAKNPDDFKKAIAQVDAYNKQIQQNVRYTK